MCKSFKVGDFVVADLKRLEGDILEVLAEVPAIEKDDTNTYYKLKVMLGSDKRIRHIVEADKLQLFTK